MFQSCVGAHRLRRLRRAARHGRVTLLCLVLTVVVLRGTIGAGKFGTPQQDLLQIRNHFHSSRNRPDPIHRLLEELRSRHTNPNPRAPRVLLVTGSGAAGRCARSVESKVEYGRAHGVEVLHGGDLLEAETAGLWARARLARKLLLARPEVDFLWWVDSDAVILDLELEVPWERYKGHNLVVHGQCERGLTWVGFESGSFMIRNCQWSLDILSVWGDVDRSAVPVERGEWEEKVYVESEYYIDGDLDQKTGGGDRNLRRRPLLARFAGCKPCGKGEEYADERCLKVLDRGFAFWEN